MPSDREAVLAGKAALIVGGGGDIGSAVAYELAVAGADIVLSYLRDDGSAMKTVEDVRRCGGAVEAIRSDATRPSEVAALFDTTVARYGHLDIVVHVVGAVLKKPLADISEADFEHVVATNLRSVFLTMQCAGRHLADRGRYVAISTTLASAAPGPYGLYAAAKAGVEVMVRSVAAEWASRGITANAVAPGPLDNEFFRRAETQESIAWATSLSPHGRLGTAGDVAPVVAFLAGPAAAWVSGQTLQVNGAML